MQSDRLKDVGERVRSARSRRGWTQEQLATEAGVTQHQVSRIESGSIDPRLTTFVAILDALELPASELIDDRRH